MNGADYLILGVLVLSMLLGFLRGFVREAIGVISWLGGLWLAWRYAHVLEPYLGGSIGQPPVSTWAARALIAWNLAHWTPDLAEQRLASVEDLLAISRGDPDLERHVDDVAGAVAGIVEDVNTLRNPNATTGEKAMATVSLLSETLSPVSLKEAKAGQRWLGALDNKSTAKKVQDSAPSTAYKDITKGSSIPNRATDISPADFGKNLESEGFSKRMSGDGKVAIYEKDGIKYTVRDTSASTGGPTAEVFKDGELVQKIRLQ